MKCHQSNTASQYWEEVIPNREDTLLEDIEVFDDFLVLNERKGG